MLTDLKENVALLEKNIVENFLHSNESQKVDCSELDWLKHDGIENNRQINNSDFIIIADCIYYEQVRKIALLHHNLLRISIKKIYFKSIEPLIQCLIKLSTKETTIFCSFEERDLGQVPGAQSKFLKVCYLHSHHSSLITSNYLLISLKLAEKYFHVKPVDKCDLDEFYQSDDIKVLIMKLK